VLSISMTVTPLPAAVDIGIPFSKASYAVTWRFSCLPQIGRFSGKDGSNMYICHQCAIHISIKSIRDTLGLLIIVSMQTTLNPVSTDTGLLARHFLLFVRVFDSEEPFALYHASIVSLYTPEYHSDHYSRIGLEYRQLKSEKSFYPCVTTLIAM
jgi:hypothetical protein